MEKYLNSEEILERWDIKRIELFALIEKGLQPYSAHTKKPVPCKHTMQGRLKTIEFQIKIVCNYLIHPSSINRNEEDWLFYKGKSPSDILKDLNREREILVNKVFKIKKLQMDVEGDSWRFFYLNEPEGFYLNYPEEDPQKVIDEVLESLFLESDIVRILGPDKKIRGDEAKYYQEEKNQTKEPKSDSEVENLIKKAIPEVEMIYAEIRKISDTENNAYKLMKNAALSKFEKNSNEFKIIKRRYLNFDKIYEIHGSNKKRDFVGMLLQKIMEGEYLMPMGIQLTYSRYKEIRRSDNTIDTST